MATKKTVSKKTAAKRAYTRKAEPSVADLIAASEALIKRFDDIDEKLTDLAEEVESVPGVKKKKNKDRDLVLEVNAFMDPEKVSKLNKKLKKADSTADAQAILHGALDKEMAKLKKKYELDGKVEKMHHISSSDLWMAGVATAAVVGVGMYLTADYAHQAGREKERHGDHRGVFGWGTDKPRASRRLPSNVIPMNGARRSA